MRCGPGADGVGRRDSGDFNRPLANPVFVVRTLVHQGGYRAAHYGVAGAGHEQRHYHRQDRVGPVEPEGAEAQAADDGQRDEHIHPGVLGVGQQQLAVKATAFAALIQRHQHIDQQRRRQQPELPRRGGRRRRALQQPGGGATEQLEQRHRQEHDDDERAQGLELGVPVRVLRVGSLRGYRDDRQPQ